MYGEVKIKIWCVSPYNSIPTIKRVTGKYIGEFNGVKLVLHKSKKTEKLFVVTEAFTGFAIAHSLNREIAVKKALHLIKKNEEKLKVYIEEYKKDKTNFLYSKKVKKKFSY